jgi:hypothetical protein
METTAEGEQPSYEDSGGDGSFDFGARMHASTSSSVSR